MSCRIQFTFVLTVLTLVLSLVPAIIIWVVFMDLMTSSMDLLKNTTLRSTDSMAVGMQELLMAQAMETVNVRLQEGENEMLAQRSMVRTSGLQQYDLRPSRFDAKTMFLPYVGEHMFNTMKGHALFSTITTAAVIHRAGNAQSLMGHVARWSPGWYQIPQCSSQCGLKTQFCGPPPFPHTTDTAS
eukprot:EG_transcript_13210